MNEITDFEQSSSEIALYNKYSIYWLAAFAAITVVVWNIPFGMYVLYPFTILGTWFHEMSHGLMAMFLGGTFHKLVINANGSGVAYFSGDLFMPRLGHALVALAGPLGPTFAGTIFIYSSANRKLTKILLAALGIFMLASALIWVRSPFGVIFILIAGFLISYVGFKGSIKLRQIVLQFLGVQAIVSVYLSVDYLFSSGAEVGGLTMKSDTAVVENYLFLPYWFWGATILCVSIFLFYLSMKYVYKQSRNN